MAVRIPIPPRYRNLLYLLLVFFIAFLLLIVPRTGLNFSDPLGLSVKDYEGIIRPDSPPFPNPWLSLQTHGARLNKTYTNIPNIFNFVYVVPQGSTDLNYEFKELLAFYGAWMYSDPDIIYLHTNAAPEAIERARSGKLGKWNGLILNMPQLIVNYVDEPTYATNGVKITLMPHKSDFVRAAALEEFGGVYIDSDAIPIRDLRPLMNTGFKTVLGRQINGEIASGHFLGEPHCRFFGKWIEDMNIVYDQRWVTHATLSMTRVARDLAAITEKEILVMDWVAWNPVSWNPVNPVGGTQGYYSVHADVQSNLEGLKDGDELKDFARPEDDDTPGVTRLEWEKDYSETYILHSWHERKGFRKPHGFDHVTPRYVLERRSDFSRAMYPIAKSLYENGFIKFDDPWKYVVTS